MRAIIYAQLPYKFYLLNLIKISQDVRIRENDIKYKIEKY